MMGVCVQTHHPFLPYLIEFGLITFTVTFTTKTCDHKIIGGILCVGSEFASAASSSRQHGR